MTSNPSSLSCGDLLKQQIKQASTSVDIQIYALSDKGLINLINKKADKIPFSIYYDPKASPNLNQTCVPSIKLTPYTQKGLMHRKIVCIDHQLSLIGSTNFTSSSLYWHYNFLCGIKSSKLASFLQTHQKGHCLFEYGEAFSLPDQKNLALNTLITKINQASASIHLAMFSLTHPSIIKALKEACERSVKLFLYLDAQNFKILRPDLQELICKCTQVFTQKKQNLLHHKLCLIDESILITGSTNWSKSGFKKNEEILVIFDRLDQKSLQGLCALFSRLQKELRALSQTPINP